MTIPFEPGLGYRTGKLSQRSAPVQGVIVHTTGGGILSRFAREGAAKGDASPFDTAVRVYTRIMSASGHYVIGQGGEVTQVVPEDVVAHHVGSAKSRPYLTGDTWHAARLADRYAWWHERWPGLASPRDLAGGHMWDGGSCNGVTLGIEVVPPLEGAGKPWSRACWASLAEVIADATHRHSVPLERDRIVTHSDAHPLSRTTPRGQPWDTVPAQWSWERFLDALHSR